MKREDYIWIAIRIFGIYLIVLSVISIPQVISSAYSTWSFWDFSLESGGASEIEPMFRLVLKLAASHFTNLLHASARMILYSVAGWYFLRRGSLVFELVNPGNPLGESTDEHNEPNESLQRTADAQGVPDEK